MTKLTFIEHNGKTYEVDATDGLSVMQAALDNDVRGILADCGGACSCATCQGYIDPEWNAKLTPVSDVEEVMLDCAVNRTEESRLTCQITVTPALEGLVIRLPKSQL
jgi:2Fe-2S ferredoxin